MPTDKLRWGVLGVAHINERLLPAFRKCAHAELRAIASRSAERAQAAAAAAGIPVAHGSYQALLDDPTVDAVYVPLPNTLHAEWTRAAADRGKHVLCEKPLTPTAAEARDLVAHCAARGVRLLDGFMWPHHPRTARIRALIDLGDIGEVRRVNGAFTFRLAPNPANIRYQADKAGGSLLDVGCYPVYAIRWAFGAEPARAFAVARYQFDVDAELAAVLTFADGRTASFDCGFTQPYRGWLEIVGSEALIQVPMMWLPPPDAPFIVRRDGREPETITVPGHDQIVCMLDGFSRAVLRGEPVRPSPEEAVRTLAVLDAVAASARQGRAVDVAG